VAYSFRLEQAARRFDGIRAPAARVSGHIGVEVLCAALQVPVSRCRSDLRGDARKFGSGERVLGRPPNAVPALARRHRGGFFRDRSTFVVGRWLLADDSIVPFVVALLNSTQGIYADAAASGFGIPVQLGAGEFSCHHPALLPDLRLFSLMPRRPFGHQYSTIDSARRQSPY
jgi:hypothetical protein